MNMLENITYYLIFGLPMIAYLGIATLTLFLATAAIGWMNSRGIRRIPFKWHPRMAKLAITFAVVHGVLGLLAYV